MGNTTVWNQHFDLLEETIDQLHLWDNPKAIFNCDESMIAMDIRWGQLLSQEDETCLFHTHIPNRENQ